MLQKSLFRGKKEKAVSTNYPNSHYNCGRGKLLVCFLIKAAQVQEQECTYTVYILFTLTVRVCFYVTHSFGFQILFLVIQIPQGTF